MPCPRCGHQDLPVDAQFCPGCGVNLALPAPRPFAVRYWFLLPLLIVLLALGGAWWLTRAHGPTVRVVLELPARAVMTYTLAKPLSPAEALAKQGKLVLALKAAGNLPAEAKARVMTEGDTVTVTTLAPSITDAAARLRIVNQAMTAVYGGVSPPPNAAAVYKTAGAAEVAAVLNTVTRRLTAAGFAAPKSHQDGADRLILEIAHAANQQRISDLLGTPGQLEFRLIPRDVTVTVDDATGEVTARNVATYQEEDLDALLARSQFVAPGSAMDGNCKPTMSNNRWAVSFTIKKPGPGEKDYRAIFAQVTRENSVEANGTGAQLAIVLDDKIISAPIIQSRIDGEGIITGAKDQEAARNLAVFLNAGALPLPVRVVEVSRVK